MSINVTYNRLSNDPTRASTLSAFGSAASGVFAAGSYGPEALNAYTLRLDTDAVSALGLSGTPDFIGNIYAFSDTQNASAAYTVQSSGSVAHFVGLTTGTINDLSVTLGILTSGTSTPSGIFVMDETSALANYASSWALVSTNSITGTAPFRWLNYDGGTNLYCIGESSVNKLALTSGTSGTWSTLTAPSTAFGLMLDQMFMNGSDPVVIGRLPMIQADIATDVIQTSTQILAIDKAASRMLVYELNSLNIPATAQSLAVSGSPTYGGLAINQLLVTDATNGTVSVLNNSVGTWSGPSQTLALANAGKIAISSDGALALVCASTLIQAYGQIGGTWSAASSAAVSGASDVAILSDTVAFAACASGVAKLNYTASWAVSEVFSLPIAVTSICLDTVNTNYVYAAGTSGGSGFAFSINVSAATYQTLSWVGSATDILFEYGYLCVLDATNTAIRVIDSTPASFTYQSSAALPTGTYTKLASGTIPLMYACSSNGWTIMQIQYPFAVDFYYNGYAWQWGGSSWTGTALGNPPLTAGCSDGTYVYVVNWTNSLFKLNAAGVVQAGYPQTVTPYSGQSAGVYLGISGMINIGSSLFFSSTEGGGIGEIIGY